MTRPEVSPHPIWGDWSPGLWAGLFLNALSAMSTLTSGLLLDWSPSLVLMPLAFMAGLAAAFPLSLFDLLSCRRYFRGGLGLFLSLTVLPTHWLLLAVIGFYNHP